MSSVPGYNIGMGHCLLWDALNDRRCDLVVGAEGAPPPGDFAQWRLGSVIFEFAVAAGHPLLDAPLPLDTTAISEFPTVIVADSARHLPGRSTGLLDGRSRLIVPSMAHKIDAQVRGLGVGYLPRHRIQRELASGALRVLPLAEPRAPVELSVAWQTHQAGLGLAWFVDRLQGMTFDPERGLVPR